MNPTMTQRLLALFAAALAVAAGGCQTTSAPAPAPKPKPAPAPATPPAAPEPAAVDSPKVRAAGAAAAKALIDRLGPALKGALADGDPNTALGVCAHSAGPITASVPTEGAVLEIKRVSDRPRNPANRADETDAAVISKFWGDIHLAEQVEPVGGKLRYYKPLRVQKLCLQCHGDPADFAPGLRANIARRYPDDRAVNYRLGDVRGAVRVLIDPSKL